MDIFHYRGSLKMKMEEYRSELQDIFNDGDYESKYDSLSWYIRELGEVAVQISYAHKIGFDEKTDVLKTINELRDISIDEFQKLKRLRNENQTEKVANGEAVKPIPEFDLSLVPHSIQVKVAEINQDRINAVTHLWSLHDQLEDEINELGGTETDGDKLISRSDALNNAMLFILDQADNHESFPRMSVQPQPNIQTKSTTSQLVNTHSQIRCPECGSKQTATPTKWLGTVEGFASRILAIAIGVVTLGAARPATVGAGRQNFLITCVACGNQWKAGKHH